MAAPDVCATCALNPANRPDAPAEKPRSGLLAYLFELEGTIVAGLPINITLDRFDRRALLTLKSERNRAEIARMKANAKR